jgi:hypothetical protein
MKTTKPDIASELEVLLEEYNLYKEADIRFLLRKMLTNNDPRYTDYRKKADVVRKAYREGRLKDKKSKEAGLA